jgi:peptidoglycan/LPS O-acetylase OafA/YrhL
MALLMMALMLLISGRFSITEFLLASLCLQPWLPNFQHSINPPGWFVADLLFFYSLFPLVFYFIKRNKPNAKILIVSSILLWILSLFIHNTILSGVSENYYNYIDCLPISWFCSFYMGICGAYYIKSVENNRIVKNDSIIYTSILIVLCSLVIIVHQGEIAVKFENYMPFEANLYAPLLLLLIMHLSVSKNYITKILSIRFFALLATISYPLYIFQAPVHNGFSYISNRFLEFQPDVFFTIFIVFFLIFTGILSFMEIRLFNWLSDRILQKGIKP